MTVLIERKQFYINLLSPKYNFSLMVGRTMGYKHIKEICKNMSLTCQKLNHPLYREKI